VDEDDIDWDDEDGEGYLDLSEMLGRPGQPSPSSDAESDDDDGADDVESESNEELEDEEDDDEDKDDETNLARLSNYVESLPATKRKGEDGNSAERKRRRVVLQEKTELMPESEFTVVGRSGDGKLNFLVCPICSICLTQLFFAGTLNIDDLLESFPNAQKSDLRKTLKPAASTATQPSNKSILKAPGPLPAPLPTVEQAKIRRRAANEKLETEVDKWNETVRASKLFLQLVYTNDH
jgi:U3 small nucleolar RNA-associated protein 14